MTHHMRPGTAILTRFRIRKQQVILRSGYQNDSHWQPNLGP